MRALPVVCFALLAAGCVDANSRPVVVVTGPKEIPGTALLPNGERIGPCPEGATLRGYPALPGAIATYCATLEEPSLRNGPFASFYPNGKLVAKGLYDHGNPDGDWVTFHENGQTLSQGTFTRGVRQGVWKFFRADGKPALEETLTATGSRASWTEYDYQKGELASFETFVAAAGKSAISQGRAGRRLPNGNSLTGQFAGNKGEGVWEERTPQGSVVARLGMTAGFGEGKVSVFWPEGGKVAAEGELVKTLPQGSWTLTYPTGDKRAEVLYEKGLLRKLTVYSQDGKRMLSGEFLDGAPHATWSSYHPNDTGAVTGTYVKGLRQGPWRSLDPGGKAVAEGLYDNGVLVEGQPVDTFLWSSLGLGASFQSLFVDLSFITAGRGTVEVDQRVIGECMLLGDPAEKCLSLDWENLKSLHEKDGSAEIERRNRLQDLACAMNNPAACARAGKRIQDEAKPDAKKAAWSAAGHYQKACDLSPIETAWKARDATGKAIYKGFHSAIACVWLGQMLAKGEVKSKAMTPADLYKRACNQEIPEGCAALTALSSAQPAKKTSK